MSYDDGSLGQREERTGPAGGRRGVLGALTRVYDSIRRHMRDYPERYVEMRARRYERE
jgi:hypothetical protein